MSDKQVRDYDKFMLRLPDGMRDSISELAKKHGRSMNAQIVHILEEYITPPKVDDMPGLTDEELKSPDKVQAWMKELSEKIAVIEKVFKKNFPE